MGFLGDSYGSNMVTRNDIESQAASRAMIRWMYEAGVITEQMFIQRKEKIIRRQMNKIMSQKFHDILNEKQRVDNEEHGPDTQPNKIDDQDDEEPED